MAWKPCTAPEEPDITQTSQLGSREDHEKDSADVSATVREFSPHRLLCHLVCHLFASNNTNNTNNADSTILHDFPLTP